MRVPYAPDVPIADQGLKYFSPGDFSLIQHGTRLAAMGARQLGYALEEQDKQAQDQQDKIAQFQTLSNFSDFESKTQDALAEAQRNYDPSLGKPFTDTAATIVQQQRDDFMKLVPDPLKPEFEQRANQVA